MKERTRKLLHLPKRYFVDVRKRDEDNSSDIKINGDAVIRSLFPPIE